MASLRCLSTSTASPASLLLLSLLWSGHCGSSPPPHGSVPSHTGEAPARAAAARVPSRTTGEAAPAEAAALRVAAAVRWVEKAATIVHLAAGRGVRL